MDSEHTRFLREVILPRLDAHEAELQELREVTWPVCQALWDSDPVPRKSMPFRNIQMKRRFFKFLHIDEIRKLIFAKARWANINCPEEELRMIQ